MPPYAEGVVLSWMIRLALLAAYCIEISPSLRSDDAQRPLLVGLSGLIVLGFAGWLASESTRSPARSRILAVSLGVLLTASAAAATTPGHALVVVLAFMAAISCGSELTGRAAWSLTVAAAICMDLGALLSRTGVVEALALQAILPAGVLIGVNRRGYRVRAEQATVLLAQAEEIRAAQRREATMDERTRIAREIHDVLAHSLGALGIQIQATRALVVNGQEPEQVVAMLENAQRTAAEGLAEVRRAVHTMRTEPAPIASVLAGLGAEHERLYGVSVSVVSDVTGDPLAVDASLAITRTVQEALTNAAKYDRDQPLSITLSVSPRSAGVQIQNLLSTRAEAAPVHEEGVMGGYGLRGLRERLQLLGGTLRAGPDGSCWTVRAEVPR